MREVRAIAGVTAVHLYCRSLFLFHCLSLSLSLSLAHTHIHTLHTAHKKAISLTHNTHTGENRSKKISDWDHEDVARWINTKGLEKFEYLVTNRVLPTGNHLLTVTPQSLNTTLTQEGTPPYTDFDIQVFLRAIGQLKRLDMERKCN